MTKSFVKRNLLIRGEYNALTRSGLSKHIAVREIAKAHNLCDEYVVHIIRDKRMIAVTNPQRSGRKAYRITTAATKSLRHSERNGIAKK